MTTQRLVEGVLTELLVRKLPLQVVVTTLLLVRRQPLLVVKQTMPLVLSRLLEVEVARQLRAINRLLEVVLVIQPLLTTLLLEEDQRIQHLVSLQQWLEVSLNNSTDTYGAIGGGFKNSTSDTAATVAGGWLNVASGGLASIGGGMDNVASGAATAIPGGTELTLSGDNSFGFHSNSNGTRTMSVAAADVAVFGNTDLWLANNDNAASQLRLYEANNTTGAFPPAATNYTSFEAAAQAANVNYILPAAAGAVGQQLTIGAVAGTNVTLNWAAASDRKLKTDFLTLSGEDILTKFRGLELGSWRYSPEIDPYGKRHYGVMAQDFYENFGKDEFGVIGTDSTVDDIDLHGVAWLAIQGLEKRTTDLQGQIQVPCT